MIVITVFDLLSVHIDAVIVVFGVHDETAPLAPAGRNVGTIVFVQVLAEVA